MLVGLLMGAFSRINVLSLFYLFLFVSLQVKIKTIIMLMLVQEIVLHI